MGAAVEAERQLQDVLEIVGHHRVAAAVRQPVGVQRDQRAAGDGEQPEAHPAAEQHGRDRVQAGAAPRLWALASASTMRPNSTGSANCAAASDTLAMASVQASLDFLAQQLEHAQVQTDKVHDADIRAISRACASESTEMRVREPPL